MAQEQFHSILHSKAAGIFSTNAFQHKRNSHLRAPERHRYMAQEQSKCSSSHCKAMGVLPPGLAILKVLTDNQIVNNTSGQEHVNLVQF
jgi:hypothetical protein